MAAKFFSQAQSPWNQKLPTDAPVRSDSATYTAAMQAFLDSNRVTWWINRGSYSCPIYHVNNSTPKVYVTLINDDNTTVTTPVQNGGGRPHLAWILAQGVPVPTGATAAQGTDMSMAVVNDDTGELWEFWKMQQDGSGNWSARWGGYMADHRTNPGIFLDSTSPLSYSGWGSSATSLPVIAGMLLDEEMRAGVIPHAIQMCVPVINPEWWWPAQRRDATLPETGVLREGTRFRLPASFDPNTLTATFSGGSAQATSTLRIIATAIRDYGLIILDRGEVLGLRGEPVANPYDYGDQFTSNILKVLPINQFQVIEPWWMPPVSAGSDGMRAG